MLAFTVYEILVVSSLLLIVYRSFIGDKYIRFEWDAYSRFISFMVMVALFRIAISYGNLAHTPVSNHSDLTNLLLVFWEDVYYVWPIKIIMDKIYPKYKYLSLVMAFALIFEFALGHQYWGTAWPLAGLYPLVAYHYSKKYGLGTVMISHITYDLMTVLTYKLLNILNYSSSFNF